LKKLVLGAERWLLRRFDTVSSISGRMTERLTQKGVMPGKVSFLPNWVDVQKIRPLASPSLFRKELGIPDDVVVVLFSGTLGNKQGLTVIPEAARLLAHRQDVEFVVCGNGVMWEPLAAAARQLPNLTLLPLQPFERLAELLGLANIHLLPQSPEAEDLVLPSKLSGMLASGRPVIATCRENSEIASVLAQCGLVVPPENGEALAKAIVELADDRARRQRLGMAARQYATEHLGQDSILGRLIEEFQVFRVGEVKV
jgi:colanic acid biosynthesis glycosyl transferase WcaI